MTIYRFGPFRLDRDRLLLALEDETLALGPKVVETLLALVEHPGEILSKSELLDRIWPEGFVEEANLAQNIYVIRKTLRAHWDSSSIETVPRRGYRFTAPVSVESSPQPHVSEPVPVPAAPEAAATPRRRVFWGALAAAVLLAIVALTFDAGRSGPAAAASKGLSADGARLYAMGTFYWNQRTQESVQKSIRYFQEVIGTDPRDARGYAGVASAYAIEGDYGFGPFSKRAAYARAVAYAKRALAVNPESAEAHAALGLAQMDTMKRAGEAEFRRALALDPNYAPAHQWYGTALLREGRGADAFAELQKATELDPESVAATDWLAEAAYMARRYNDAVNYARQTLDLSPRRYDAYTTLGLAYEALGDYRHAIEAYDTYGSSCRLCRVEIAPFLAHAYGASHHYVQAEVQLRIAQAGMAAKKVDAGDIVTALVAMGRRTEALRMLHDVSRSNYDSALLAIDPRMDPVRGDARFREFVQSPA